MSEEEERTLTLSATLEAVLAAVGVPEPAQAAAPLRPDRGALAEGVVVADRFRLVRELGRGSMGAVWLAHHLGLRVPCAVKFQLVEAGYSDAHLRRVEREARAAALLRSPHVVQVLDHGLWNGRPYIAMEHLEGEDLRRRLHRQGRLSAADTARIVGQVARGLARAHSAAIIHRDLKPDNIFLAADEDGEVAKILDFGIAKGAGGGALAAASAAGAPPGPGAARGAGEGALITVTAGGTLLGTPAYMSPEQAEGGAQVDHRSDLWALGVITFECLAGRRPFDAPALGDLLLQIMVDPIPKASALAADLPPGFDAWWARACARDPEQRFQSARQLADALAEVLGAQPARPSAESLPDAASPPPPPAEPPRQDQPAGPAAPAESSTLPAFFPPAPAPSLAPPAPPAPTMTRERRRALAGAALGAAAAVTALGLAIAWPRSSQRAAEDQPATVAHAPPLIPPPVVDPPAAEVASAPASQADVPPVEPASTARAPRAGNAAQERDAPPPRSSKPRRSHVSDVAPAATAAPSASSPPPALPPPPPPADDEPDPAIFTPRQ